MAKIKKIKIGGKVVGWAEVEDERPKKTGSYTYANVERKITKVIINKEYLEPASGMLFELVTEDPTKPPMPTEPGFYKYAGGDAWLVFLLRRRNDNSFQWYVVGKGSYSLDETTWDAVKSRRANRELVKI